MTRNEKIEIAQTIIEQLGGSRFIAMTGAKNILATDSGVNFKVGRNARKVTHVQITLTARDDYLAEFFKIRAGTKTRVAMVPGLYDVDLAKTFTAKTGMETRL